MRQAGVLAAAGLIALEEMPRRLREDHANARFLADALSQVRGVAIDPARVQTNILIFDVSGTGLTGAVQRATEGSRSAGESGRTGGAANGDAL